MKTTTDLETRAVDSFEPLPRGLQARIDFRLVPILAFMYGMSLIDRTDLPAARLAGMDAALGLSIGQRYTIVALVFFPPYILGEIPANWLFKRTGIAPRWWLPTWTMMFGIIKLASTWVNNWGALAGIRVLLGITEGALFPGCVYLISCWYPRHELAKRVSLFYLSGALLGGFGNIIAYGWSTIPNSALAPWRWIFLMMGVLTIISGMAGYIAVPNFPTSSAKHISEDERELVLKRIAIDRHDIVMETLTFGIVMKNLANPRIWIYGLLFCLTTLPTYAFAYFLSLILRTGLGYSYRDAQIYSAFPYIVATVFGGILAVASDRLKHRGAFVAGCALLSLTGTAVLGYATDPNARYGLSFLALMGCQSNIGMIVSWSSNNVRTMNQRAVNSAVVVAGGGVGGIIASVAFQQKDAPLYRPGLLTVIVSQVVIVFIVALLEVWYVAKNKKADRGEVTLEGHSTYRYTL